MLGVDERTTLGPFGMGPPSLAVVEAENDDFPRGWAHCLAAMIAIQKINDHPDRTIYGIATSGRCWEFGHEMFTNKKAQNRITQELELFVIRQRIMEIILEGPRLMRDR